MSHHVPSVKMCLSVFFSLLILTALTVWVAGVDLGAANTFVALAVAITKGSLVILFFMGVRWNTPLTKTVAISGFLWLLILFGIVIAYGIGIAMRSRSQFGRILAMGLTVNFFLYIMINGLMVMGLIPVVGIPMPLISYGGTAMMTVMFGFGLLMSVHVHRHVEVPRHSSGMI